MKNKLIISLDRVNRIKIPSELMELAELKGKKQIAFCKCEEGIMVKSIDNIKDCKVLGKGTMDVKNRFIIPKYIRDNTTEFEVFVLNQKLVIKEVE